MSEYWKSTPKYWCKFCKLFVKDTPFSKKEHDATPRHQGNIQRSLRTLHKENERSERDADRAKSEVERLKGVVSGAGSSGGKSAAPTFTSAGPPKQASAEERKRQIQQLAAMGVVVPKEFRAEVAMPGEWETVAVKKMPLPPKREEEDVKPEALALGVRKRKFEGQEEEEEAGEVVVRKGWGHTTRNYPGGYAAVDDIEALMKAGGAAKEADVLEVKKEEDVIEDMVAQGSATNAEGATSVKQEDMAERTTIAAPVVFKKRKAKVVK
jgi:hypothetical protein